MSPFRRRKAPKCDGPAHTRRELLGAWLRVWWAVSRQGLGIVATTALGVAYVCFLPMLAESQWMSSFLGPMAGFLMLGAAFGWAVADQTMRACEKSKP